MKQLIVNADDFGLTKRVSEGIVDAHRHGVVSSTTLMANGGAFEAAVALRRQAPHLGIGVHLNLSEGIPVSPALRIPSLLNARGRLYLTPGRLWRAIVTRQVSLADVETELRAQIAKIQRAGILPTHCDGHKHVHVLPGVSDIVIRLAREFSIPSVRCPLEEPPGLFDMLDNRRISRASVLKQYLVGRGVSALARRFRQKLAEAGLACPTHFYGISQTGFLDARGIHEVLRQLPEGTSELMCHPGYADAALAKTGTRLLVQREIEKFALCSPFLGSFLEVSGIRLVNYQALAGLPQSGTVAA
jgi:hopanoid biosynthesis associated protein HpnK